MILSEFKDKQKNLFAIESNIQTLPLNGFGENFSQENKPLERSAPKSLKSEPSKQKANEVDQFLKNFTKPLKCQFQG